MSAFSEITYSLTLRPVASASALSRDAFTLNRPVAWSTMVLTSLIFPMYSLPFFSIRISSPTWRPPMIFSVTAKETALLPSPEITQITFCADTVS